MKKFILFLLIAICGRTNAQYTRLLDFAGATNGNMPWGSLVSEGSFLYGMTFSGGTSNFGTVFKMMPDGSGYLKLLDFTGTVNGSSPAGALVSDGTFLYGMTNTGGANNMGTVFKIMPDGSGYVKLLDFSGTANGRNPYGSLIFEGSFLYGMTSAGGTGNFGTLFKIMPDGSGYVKLLDFTGAANGNTPHGSLVTDGTFLYGMTRLGGANGLGTIFKIMPDGSGYVKLLDFSSFPDASQPLGSLVSDGTFLYGMTQYGGVNDDGALFKIMPDGSGYVRLLDFAGASNGSSPLGSLISDGAFLYGMTYSGGASDNGTLFKIMPDGSGYTKLLDFVGATNGSHPIRGNLISDGSFLYGMTSAGGLNNYGTVFKYGLTTGIVENSAKENFDVFPNPSDGIFQLQNGLQPGGIIEAEVYNVTGEKIYSSKINSISSEIDLSNQCNGVYFLNLKTENGIEIKKLIISK
ncbi:MAG: hypothetical protein JWP12_2346 [Bacteroidetes bacterium]|nr:hypothetical protein [Bacteroidota bacterium]